jgi:NADPH:quinone reductase-like Zn-dependent oxidoreductase
VKDIPRPGAGEVWVNSISLNYNAGKTIEGLFNHHKAMDLQQTVFLYADAAGETFEIGGGVTMWMNGDRVCLVRIPSI